MLQRHVAVKRFLAFVAAIVHIRDDGRPDECEEFVAQLLRSLLTLTCARDKVARHKLCELLGQIFRFGSIGRMTDCK
jgi:hypothetical protein